MKKIWIHAAFIVAMLIVSLVYFLPALEGKVIVQGDIQKYEAMAKMQKDAREATKNNPMIMDYDRFDKVPY